MRRAITDWALEPDLEAVCLTSLVEAADRVDSTTGVQMAFLKRWARRAKRDIELRLPEILPGRGEALQLEAEEAAGQCPVDVAYLDPPYNHHSYRGNYHLWETLVQGDEPETYGKARKRVDVQAFKSAFNSKPGIRPAMERVLDRVRARHVIVSFNNEGNLRREELLELLDSHGETLVIEVDHPRYVGARIGIHSPQGRVVGQVSHVRNKELLFVTTRDAHALGELRRRFASGDLPAIRSA